MKFLVKHLCPTLHQDIQSIGHFSYIVTTLN